MKPPFPLRLAVLCFVASLAAVWLPAQVAPTPVPSTTAADKTSGNAAFNPVTTGSKEPETFEMSPFEVSEAGSQGYQATSTMSGTRLNSNLEDIAAAISVVTKP